MLNHACTEICREDGVESWYIFAIGRNETMTPINDHDALTDTKSLVSSRFWLWHDAADGRVNDFGCGVVNDKSLPLKALRVDGRRAREQRRLFVNFDVVENLDNDRALGDVERKTVHSCA